MSAFWAVTGLGGAPPTHPQGLPEHIVAEILCDTSGLLLGHSRSVPCQKRDHYKHPPAHGS
ncbi:protein of unknown function (plasmid) [Cupriavidus taiwanensis]|uniref:Uncharacterized protein n=1 Tax=Cupriavidus taiwanensis TaxID=164546 RepID=A0A375EEM9_9BURK|nr:protein of unknown function [Cupriavidus taiwanensis]SOZ74537.1 protein of unknown function [Cupriavidus taiwanensis]